ncbi:uncharacterized protein BX664DRAFT_360113 [Halteromyces radiatus]|uniref:uncharacterized protein n=1 Tax=Halteromyces radiatus TaxID=101107 RepID=UPI0022210B35|nr:uncharacterized protein BX664DRAFT_360113 [Halteromyces radiatus]KAI8086596.1 hypothetical protein BX664DRAFT_360113 [Halteromyces radiatus]
MTEMVLNEGIPRNPNDIAALFNQLQVTVDQAQQKSRLLDNTSSRPSSLTSISNIQQEQQKRTSISSTTSKTTATTTTITPNSSLMTCPCHHWLVSMDSEHCAICDAPNQVMTAWQNERIERSKVVRAHRRQLMDMTATQDQQQNDMMLLQKTILEHRESLMTRDDDILSLQYDIEQLQTKYNDESAQIEAIEISKQAAKREIEELGQHLFKEARDMVATEQQEKMALQSSCDDLKQQLEQTQLDLDQVTVDLQALRMDMGRWGDQQDEQRILPHIITSSNHTENDIVNDNTHINNERTSTTTATTTTSSSSSCSSVSTPTSSHMLDNSSTILPSVIPTTSQKFLIRAKMDLAALQEDQYFLDENLQLETFEDDQQLTDFREFMDSATSTTFSLRKLHGLPFIKLCVADDIEPCLRFGPHPKMTNSKKILEAIQIKTCFVEKCPPGFVREQAAILRKERLAKKAKPSLWDKFSVTTSLSTPSSSSSSSPLSSPLSSSSTTTTTSPARSSDEATMSPTILDQRHYMSCSTCGRRVLDNEEDPSIMEKELGFRFRISYFDEWACIDRYCADRLNSVIAFYTFLRQLRLGHYKDRSLMDVYQECSRLRLVMFLSRLGALPPPI